MTRNLPENQKNVIAVVANVAAFDLCGSSKCRHWGEEQLKRVWEGKRHPSASSSSPWIQRVMWFFFFFLVQTCQDTKQCSLKTLTPWKRKKKNMAQDPLLEQQMGNLCKCVQFWGQMNPPRGEAAPLMCANKRIKSGHAISPKDPVTWQTHNNTYNAIISINELLKLNPRKRYEACFFF